MMIEIFLFGSTALLSCVSLFQLCFILLALLGLWHRMLLSITFRYPSLNLEFHHDFLLFNEF